MALNKIKLIAFIILSNVFFSEAQSKFWIKLSDKNGTPYSISSPTAFLTPKSIQRRTNQGISIDNTDLPCTPSYVNQIDAVTDVQVMFSSKWLNAVVVVITNTNAAAISTATNAINSFSFVTNTTPTNRFKVDYGTPVNVPENNYMSRTELQGQAYYGGGYWQAHQLNADCIHNYGYRGQGMTIAIIDAGFKNANTLAVFDSLRARNGILGTRDFVTGGTSVYEDDSHGTSVLSCIAGVVPGVLVGTAPQAEFWLLRSEDAATETPSEEYNWIRAAEFADSVGVDITTTSLGYTTMDNPAYDHTYSGLDGKTYAMSIAATMAVRKGIFVLNAAGNEGSSAWHFIGVPADADSICTVGAIDSLSNVTGFSSKGPTSDSRIKPDLVARGGNAYVATSYGTYGPGNGTSFATPVLAGAVACFWQKHNTFKAYEVLDTLRKTASNALTPDNSKGWGVPDMCALPVGIKKLTSNLNDIRIFPNPVKSLVKIQTGKDEVFSLTLTNSIGQVILLSSFKKETELNIAEWPSGIYFIEIRNDSGVYTEKIVKE